MALRSAAAAAPRSLRRLITGTSTRTLPIISHAIHDWEKPEPSTNAFLSGRLFSSASTSSFIPPPLPPSAQQREMPEPSTNLFVSGNSFFLNPDTLRLFALTIMYFRFVYRSFSGCETANVIVFYGFIPAKLFLCGVGVDVYWSLGNFIFLVLLLVLF